MAPIEPIPMSDTCRKISNIIRRKQDSPQESQTNTNIQGRNEYWPCQYASRINSSKFYRTPCVLSVLCWQLDAYQVDDFVNTYLVGDDAIECVLKPTHLSNASGVLSLSKVPPDEHEQVPCMIWCKFPEPTRRE